MDQVECPRCALRLSARLHAIVSTDGQECPSCLGRDNLEIPMFVVTAEISRTAPLWPHLGSTPPDGQQA